jgi:phage terminase small subunit
MDGIFRQTLTLVEEGFKPLSSQNQEVCLDPPETFSYEAKCEWIRACPDLTKRGVLVGGNIGIFENYCISMGMAKEFEAMLEVDGKIISGKPHPAFKMMIEAMTSAKSLWGELKPRGKDKEQEEEDTWGKDKGLLA